MNKQHIFTPTQSLVILLALLAGLAAGWYGFHPAGAQAAPSEQITAVCSPDGDAVLINPPVNCDQTDNGGATITGVYPTAGTLTAGQLAAVEQAQLLMMMSSLPHYVYLPTVLK
ncbi:MAG: hypothetical protein D6816_17660 [Bacteroidetes bacterium]|nr:MAG: hypothetical protein D6816_17660 [Bacteroidota bacterium]